MHLENIKLLNFKNYEELSLEFSNQINCFVGDNGAGKTNLLDAIHYLSLTKSAFNPIDSQNILREQEFFMIKGVFDTGTHKDVVLCHLKNGQKKVVKYNNNPYDKLSDHIGKLPIVIITPGDQGIIQEGSETRRKFFDNVLSQIYPVYLNNLIRYHLALKQRNALLKQFTEKNYFDKDLIEPYTNELLISGKEIHKIRFVFVEKYVPVLKELYQEISDSKETIEMVYQSDLQKDGFEADFVGGIKRDLALQRTAVGVHRDDFEFLIDGFSLKKFGSQGQQKSFVVALKLAQFRIIQQVKKFKPLLLMDDIFDKLDDKRINKLMEMVSGHAFGQLFVTDARPERTAKIFENITSEIKMFQIMDGKAVF